MKKIFKTSVAIILNLALILGLTGCGEEKKAEKAVNSMFNAFQNLDFETAKNYVNLDDIKVSESEDSVTGNAEMFMKTLFGKLDYKILSSEKTDNNTVMVKTQITAIDMKPVMGEFFTNAMQYAFSNAFADPQLSEEETNKKMEEMFIESATKPDLATVTNEVNIKVVKADKTWKISADDTFTNALLGGLIDVAKDMENSFNKAE